MTTSDAAPSVGSSSTLVTIEGSWNFVVSSKPSCRTRCAAATRRAANASSTMRSSKRHSFTVACVGPTGSSHDAVRFTIATMIAPT
eukprot:3783969-Prymnesium_polylepis.1